MKLPILILKIFVQEFWRHTLFVRTKVRLHSVVVLLFGVERYGRRRHAQEEEKHFQNWVHA